LSVAIHCARGRLGHRPVRRVSDREVLAALVPERVLPFASGGSRKRGLSRAGAQKDLGCRGGAPKGERTRSMRSARPRSSHQEDRRKGARRIVFRCGPMVRLSALRLPSFKGGVSWLGFSWRFLGKARMRRRIATTKRLVIAARDPLLVTTGLDPVVHAASPNTHWSKVHSAIQHRPLGQARW
jgi:hypothetical protein